VPLAAIAADLAHTQSVDVTVDNLLQRLRMP
jgi:hypothetical protein